MLHIWRLPMPPLLLQWDAEASGEAAIVALTPDGAAWRLRCTAQRAETPDGTAKRARRHARPRASRVGEADKVASLPLPLGHWVRCVMATS